MRISQKMPLCCLEPKLVVDTLVGMSKVDIVYVGKAWATILSSVDLPAHDKVLLLHPFSLASNLSCKNLKSFARALVRNKGAHK